MDPWTAEQLSRLLDGDLDAAEEERLRARLAVEPALAAELDSLRRLQQQVRAVAARMEPPAVLDAALKPLASGSPAAPRRLPTPVRWLGIAAGLALGVTVAIEVARRPPEPMVAPDRHAVTPAPAPGTSGFYQLQPLPTRAAQAGDEPVGVADRLVASPYAEPPLPDPAPLDVRGPLPEPESTGGSEGAPGEERARRGAVAAPAESDAAKSISSFERRSQEAGAAAPQASTAAPAPVARDEAAPPEALRQELAEESSRSGRLLLIDGAGSTLAELEVDGVSRALPELVATVQGELLVEIDGDVSDATRRSAIGRRLPGVADGRYRGRIVPSRP